MFREIDTQRIRQVHHLLTNMADGKFGEQIELSGEDDDLEALVVLVNLMSEEMQETLSFYSVLRSPDSTQDRVSKAIVLDQDNTVIRMNRLAREELLPNELPKGKLAFSKLLSPSSLGLWQVIAKKIAFENDYEGTHTLVFRTASGLNDKATCSILTLSSPERWRKITIIVSYESKRSSILLEDELRFQLEHHKPGDTIYDKHHVLKSNTDIQILQRVYFYLLEHLDTVLPPQKELARMFGINENKLKYGFKQLYCISINRFITAERLKKASLLVQHTERDMRSIATACGFKSPVHFSRAFKERYGHSPIQLRRYIQKRDAGSDSEF